MEHEIVVIGAGISGLTIAERYANKLNKKVLIIEKRNHIGGNCYDLIDNQTGILISKYGAHIFHTSYEDVWEYINKFSKWKPYYHKVLSSVDNKLVPIPVNIDTVNSLFNLNIKTTDAIKQWFAKEIKKINHPANSEESALSRVGPRLYEKLFKYYTYKQWNLWPKELDASVMNRIPVRNDFDDLYFNDKYQALPLHGYSSFFNKMISSPNITIKLKTNYLKIKNKIKAQKTFFTGPIDQFYNNKFGKLQYRSLHFKYENIKKQIYQKNSVINFPSQKPAYTRIIEFKHFNPIKTPDTIICKEYPRQKGEPYYPVPTKENQKIYLKYKNLASNIKTDKIYFIGRLANYTYINMDQAFKNALDLFNMLENE